MVSLIDHIYFNLAVFCFLFSVYIYVPLFSVYLESIGFAYTAIGIILGGYGVTQIIFRFPLGILTDILHRIRKKLFLSGYVCAFISALLLIYFDFFFFVLVARLLADVTAAMWVLAPVLYSHDFRQRQRAEDSGRMHLTYVTPHVYLS